MTTQPEPQPLPCPYPDDAWILQDPGGFTDDTVPTAGGGGTRTGEEAVAWAQAQIARPTQDWTRLCLMFVRMSYRVPVIIADAGKSWDRSTRKHRTSDPMAIPRAGGGVYFELPSVADHVAFPLGDGWCLSNDILRTGRIDRVRIQTIIDAWGARLLGWTDDINGILVREAPPVAKPLPVHLVDISHHQDYTIDWSAAKRAGLRGVYHKATEGTTVRDGRYAGRRQEAAKAGVPFGAYHFARPSGDDAAAEAERFLAVAKPTPGDLVPMLDLEDDGGMSVAALTRWVGEWVRVVSAACGGAKPYLYVGTYRGKKLHLDDDFGCRLWAPRYNDDNREPVPTRPWGARWSIFQFSNGELGTPRRGAGFPGKTDLNTMKAGTRLLRIPAPPPPKRLPLNLRVEHASQQFSDSAQDFEASLAASLKRGLPLIGLTEVGKASRAAALRAQVAADGRYTLVWAEGGSAVLTRLPVLDKGVVPVLDAIPGPPSKGGRGPRGIAWVTVRAGQETVTYAVFHEPTGYHKGGQAALDHRRLTAAVGKLAEEKGAGRSIFMWSTDANLDDAEGTGGAWQAFADAGLVTCWDDVGKWPATSHGYTFDVVGRYAPDTRARFIAATAQPEGTSDHRAVTATLRVEP